MSKPARSHRIPVLLALLVVMTACSESGSTSPSPDAAVTDANAADTRTTDVTATDVTATDVTATDVTATDTRATDAPATDVTATDVTATDVTATDTPATDAPATDVGRDETLVALTVTPATATVRITDPAMRPATNFVATGRTRDGRSVTVNPVWSVAPSTLAAVRADGTVTPTGLAGGEVTVTARSGTLAASASLRVVLDLTVTAPGTPADTETLFPAMRAPEVDAARTPAWIYPASETLFPQNVDRVLFQWRPAGNDRYRITFESDRARVVVFTDGAHPTCARAAAATGLACFEPVLAVWRWLAASNPHGSMRVLLDAASSRAPGRYYRASTLVVGFSRGPVPGAIYYWSTTARGVRRANLAEGTPRNFLTPAEASGACVACHTLSRQGNRLAADVGGNAMWIVEASPTTPPPRLVTQYNRQDIPMFWSTFSPDESRVVTAARGVMTLRNAANGAPVNTVPFARNVFGTQPDWAPDASLVAFTQSAANRDRGVSGGRIAVIEAGPGDTWGAARILYGTGMSGDTNQFPSFSWDSQWVAFTHATRDGQNDLTSDTWLVRRDGSGARPLTRANTVVNNGTITTPTVQDNMPTWAPTGTPDDYAWVAFSSTRDYGAVLSGTSRLGRREQIWVAAVDLTRAATGDPSHPAFRLPCQDLDEDTHRPFWALDRVRPACTPAETACAVDTDCCAPLTCNGGTCGAACRPLAATCAASADCCAPAVCLGGLCRSPCVPAGGACDGAAACCAPGTCTAGTCTAPPCRVAGSACTTSADCCAGGTCTAGVCVPPACRGLDAACATGADCCAPLSCTAGRCRELCRARGATCASAAECCAPDTCRGGLCGAACNNAGGACAVDADCCAPTSCRDGRCAVTCNATGAACTTSADCCAPASCNAGSCRAPCTSSGGACSTDSDCCDGATCNAGSCRPPCRPASSTCTANSDCCSGTCTRGACAAPPCRGTGGSCNADSDCCSGFCVSGGCAPG